MATIRSRWAPRVLLPLAGLCILSAGLWAAEDVDDLLKRAQTQYDRHNYKQALVLADKAMEAAPAQPLLRSLQRLRTLSLCQLRDDRAEEYAKQIMADDCAHSEDADLWLSLGDFRARRWPRKPAFESYIKAAELYEKADRLTDAADALFKAAELLRRDHNILPVQQQARPDDKPLDWQAKRQAGIDEAIRLYERIAAMKIDDGRRAKALLLAGERAAEPGDWGAAARAIELNRRCVKDFAKTASAPHAQYRIGELLENFNKFVEAVDEYRLVFENYPAHDLAKQARKRVEHIKAPQVALGVETTYLPGQEAKLYWQIRNVRKLHITARKIDLVEAVGRMRTIHDAVDVMRKMDGPVAATWAFDTPDAGKHQWYQHLPLASGEDAKQTTVAIDVPINETGAYLITAQGVNADGKQTQGHCLVVFSNIAAVAKTDADETIIFVNDVQDSAPVVGADVAVTRHWDTQNHQPKFDRAAGKTNDAGLAELELPRRRWVRWIVGARKGDDQALCAPGGYSWGWWGYRRQYMVYGFTERPVYRPGDSVHFKQIIRRNTEGEYKNLPDTKVRVEIRNPKGDTIYTKDLVTDKFGAAEGQLKIDASQPLGLYNIRVLVAGDRYERWHVGGNQFRVEEYKKPEFKVTIEPGQADYRIGDEMKIKIAARYYFGQPVVNAEVKFRIRKQSYTHRYEWPRRWGWYYDELRYGRRRWRPWWHPRFDELAADGTIRTDANGEAFVTVKADAIKGHEELDLKFVVSAEVTDASRRVIRGGGEVKVTHAPFFVYPKPAQSVYGPGDSVEILIKTEDPNKKPVPGRFTVEAWRIERIRKLVKDDKGNERVEFEEKLAQKVYAGEVEVSDTGRASVRFVPDLTGQIKVIVREKMLPPKGNQNAARKGVEGSCELWIASKTGVEAHYAYNDLQLIPSSDQYEIGQTMSVLINTNHTDSYVLLTGEADDLLFRQIVHVPGNSKLVEIAIDRKLCPNFTLTGTLLRDNKLYADSKKVVVPPTHQFLKVETQMTKGDLGGGEDNKYQPREKATVRVKLTDVQTGKPVAAQVTLFMVDSSVYYIQPEFRKAIEKAFYGYVRPHRVQTSNSFAGPPSLTRLASQVGHPGLRGVRKSFGGVDRMGVQQAMPDAAMPTAEMTAGRRMDKSAAREAPALAETIVRKHFADTVLWAGSVVTDADGLAEVPVTMPDQLTTFALHAVAADKDTRVGQSRGDVITTKRVIVRLEGGRFFTEGDRSYVTVIAHNYYDEPQELVVDLAATDNLAVRKVWQDGKWQDYKAGQALPVTVAPGGERRIDFLTEALRPGQVVLTARARGVKESDALELTKPILEWGARKIVSHGGALRGGDDQPQTAQFTIDVPAEIKPGTQELTITLNPSIAAVAMESLGFLARYPYGCVEQTMSRFLPTVVMRKTLQDAGVKLDEIRQHIEHEIAKDPKLAAKWEFLGKKMRRNPVYSAAEVDRMIAAGLKRLADMQHGDGGWGWWKHGQSNPYMTAYVAYGLSVAKDCDVKLPGGMLERAVKFLVDRAGRPKVPASRGWWWRHLDNDNTRIYMLYVIGQTRPDALRDDEKLRGHLDRINAGRDELSDYGRAYLALALHAAGRADEARIVVENFDNTADVDEKQQTASWGRRSGWWYWYHGSDETTAWVLQAMMTIRPDDKYIPMAVNYLVHNRRELNWGNTKATAMVVYALARYAKQAGELDADQTYTVVIDDVDRYSVRVTRENLFTFDDRIVIPAGKLTPGKHSVRITRSGRGSLYWGGYLRYFTTAERIAGSGHGLTLTRKYFRLVPEKFDNTRRVWKAGKWVKETFPDFRYNREPLEFGAEIASGEMIDVEIGMDASENLEYMIFEDPKPAGCEPYRLVSGASYGGGAYANMELRDTKVVFFANWIGKGQRTLTYRLVCEQPGTFRILPSGAEAMYTPFIEAISDSGKLVITTKPGQ